MKLQAGDEQLWPQQAMRLHSGELLLLLQHSDNGGVTERLPLLSLEAGAVLPPHPSGLDDQLSCRIRALQPCELEPVAAASDGAIAQAEQALVAALQPSGRAGDGLLPPLLQALWAQHRDQQQQRQQRYAPLDGQSAQRLFLHLEDAMHGLPGPGQPQPDGEAGGCAMQACVDALLRERRGSSERSPAPRGPAQLAAEPRQRLYQWLDINGLIGRDVVISGDLRHQDCGDLIGFLEQDPGQPVLLQSSSAGYRIWIPGPMAEPLALQQAPQLMERINPRMVAVSLAFTPQDLTSLGLLRFAYGDPRHRAAFVVGGLLLGVALGLLLAIGREVGAARWIFGMGFTGLAIGTSLGFLSGGFRVGVAVMLLATLLGLLTPTFNTIITNQALPDRDLGLLLQIAGILIAAGITRVALEWTQSRALLFPQQQGATRSQLATIQRMLSLPIDFFRHYSMGDLQLRFSAIDELRSEIQTLLDGGLLKIVLSSIYMLFLLKISVKLTMLAFVIALMLLIPTALVGLQSRPLQRRQEEIDGQAQSRNLELISSVAKLRLAGAETRAAGWWADQYRRSITIEQLLDAKEAVGQLLSTIIPNLGNLLLYIVITKLLAEAAETPTLSAPNAGQLLGFFSAFGTFIGAMSSFAGLLIGAFDLPTIYERAQPILKAQSEQSDQLLEAGRLEGGLSFDRVSYRYAPDLPLVLDGVSFVAKPGDFVAMVGPSGSGKSTLVRLMLGFAKPENGEIRVDGQPLNGLRPDSLRRQIGTVLQNSALFSGNLFEAIAGGCLISLDEAWAAAEMAGLADDIRQMPMGMQTVIPDGGGTLSGGQRQRVAIARALVRRPRLLIFDEATSALDNRTQAVVSQSLEQLAITRIVIAHRLSTVRHANQILVLERGQVRQRGSFKTLMAEPGLFAQMMERQIA